MPHPTSTALQRDATLSNIFQEDIFICTQVPLRRDSFALCLVLCDSVHGRIASRVFALYPPVSRSLFVVLPASMGTDLILRE